MRNRRETVEHPFGTMKSRMGALHFLTKTLPKVPAEMALTVTRVMNIVGIKTLIAAIVLGPTPFGDLFFTARPKANIHFGLLDHRPNRLQRRQVR